jgi:hypothetical protein
VKIGTLRTSLAFATALFLGSFESAKAQGNLVFNGGFDADATGWTPSNNLGTGYDSSNGNPGGCIDLFGKPNPSISQTITGLTIGASYIVSGDYISVRTPYGNGFGVALNGDYSFFDGSTSWQHFSFIYTADSSSTILSLVARQNGTEDAFRVDNISMVAVPEPSSICFLGMSGVACLFFSRCKRDGAEHKAITSSQPNINE